MLHITHRVLALLLLLVYTCASAANSQLQQQQQQQSQPAPPQYRTVNNTVVLSVTEHTLAPDALLVDLSTISPRAVPPSGQQQQQVAPLSGSTGTGAVWEYILKSVRPESARDTLALRHATLRLSPTPTATLDRERLCPRTAAGSGSGNGHHLQTERSERSPPSRSPVSHECTIDADVVRREVLTRLSETIRIKIVVLDANDEWPEFGTTQATISVDENTQGSFRLPVATDADSEQHAVCAYTLQAASNVEQERERAGSSVVSTLNVGGSGRRAAPRPNAQPAVSGPLVYGAFELEVSAQTQAADGAAEPRLVVRKELDRETSDRFELTLTAFDCTDRQRVRFDSPTASKSTSPTSTSTVYSPVLSHSYFGNVIFITLTSQIFMIFWLLLISAAVVDATNADPHSPGVSIINITTFNYSSPPHQQPQTSLPQALVRIRVSEAVPEGQLLLWARARDPDVGENARVLYELDPDAPAAVRAKFGVDSNTGDLLLRTGAILDYEEQREFAFSIIARNPTPTQSQSSARLGVVIEVADANDNAPKIRIEVPDAELCSGEVERDTSVSHLLDSSTFNIVCAQIREDVAPGTLVAQIFTSDQDSSVFGSHNCYLQEELDAVHFRLVNISKNTYEVRTRDALDRETRAEHRLRIICEEEDQATAFLRHSGSSERSLQIVILDVNEHAPQLTPESAALHILENSAPNTLVGRLSARDADSAPDGSPARDVVFALLSSSAHSNGTASAANDSSFALWRLESDGRLYALQSLDRERVSTYRLRVRLLDAGGLNSSATLLLNVDDVDDNPPEFSNHSYSFTISEDRTPVKSMQVDQVDRGALARLNPLKSTTPLCREASGSVPHGSYGTLVGRVSAFDRDVGENANIRYRIASASNAGDVHFVVSEIGDLYACGFFDRETISMYTVNVIAEGNNPHLAFAAATVYVQLSDLNDNDPTFEEPFGSETQGGSMLFTDTESFPYITRVRAKDPDFGPNGEVRVIMDPTTQLYEILVLRDDELRTRESDRRRAFSSINRWRDSHNGQPVVCEVVRLIASDGGSPSRTATVTLTLDYPRSLILDADDSQSAFDPSGSHSFIPDGSLSGRATNKRPANQLSGSHGGDANAGATSDGGHRSWWAGLLAFETQYVLVAGLVIICAVLAFFLFGVLCIVRKDLSLRPSAAANRPTNKASGAGQRQEAKAESLRKDRKRVLSPLLAGHLEAGAAQTIDSRFDLDCDRVADVSMQRNASQRYKASLLQPVAAPAAVDSRSNSCDSNRDSIANGVDEVVTPSAVVFTPAASQQQPHCFVVQQSADQMNAQPPLSQLGAGAQFEPNPETGTCDGEADDFSHREEYSQRSSASKTHNRKKATQSESQLGANQMMAICPQQTAFHSLVRPSPQHYQQPLGAPHPCLVEINNNGIVDTIGSQSGAAPVASVLDAHLVHSAIGNGQCPYFSLPTAPYPFPQYQSLYTHAQWTDPRQLQQFQFQPVEPSVPLNQFQSNDHRALTLQAPKSSTPNGHNSESAAAEPFIARAGQFAPQPPATQVHNLLRRPVPQSLQRESNRPTDEVPAAIAFHTPQMARTTPRQMRFETSCV